MRRQALKSNSCLQLIQNSQAHYIMISNKIYRKQCFISLMCHSVSRGAVLKCEHYENDSYYVPQKKESYMGLETLYGNNMTHLGKLYGKVHFGKVIWEQHKCE